MYQRQVYSKLKEPLTREELTAIYQECYQDKPFVRIQASLPNLHQVVGTNYTDIGFDYNPCLLYTARCV